MLEGWTGPGELVCGLGFKLGFDVGTLGLAEEGGGVGPAEGGGGGAAPDFADPRVFRWVGVDPTGLGLGDRLGEEFRLDDVEL